MYPLSLFDRSVPPLRPLAACVTPFIVRPLRPLTAFILPFIVTLFNRPAPHLPARGAPLISVMTDPSAILPCALPEADT